jgi:hypothetical protein
MRERRRKEQHMTQMRVTVRVEIEHPDGSVTVIERTVVPTGFGGNPIFYGNVAEQASLAARVQVCEAIEAVHGKAPRAASVRIPGYGADRRA